MGSSDGLRRAVGGIPNATRDGFFASIGHVACHRWQGPNANPLGVRRRSDLIAHVRYIVTSRKAAMPMESGLEFHAS